MPSNAPQNKSQVKRPGSLLILFHMKQSFGCCLSRWKRLWPWPPCSWNPQHLRSDRLSDFQRRYQPCHGTYVGGENSLSIATKWLILYSTFFVLVHGRPVGQNFWREREIFLSPRKIGSPTHEKAWRGISGFYSFNCWISTNAGNWFEVHIV